MLVSLAEVRLLLGVLLSWCLLIWHWVRIVGISLLLDLGYFLDQVVTLVPEQVLQVLLDVFVGLRTIPFFDLFNPCPFFALFGHLREDLQDEVVISVDISRVERGVHDVLDQGCLEHLQVTLEQPKVRSICEFGHN